MVCSKNNTPDSSAATKQAKRRSANYIMDRRKLIETLTKVKQEVNAQLLDFLSELEASMSKYGKFFHECCVFH
jgi:hypothetical protein